MFVAQKGYTVVACKCVASRICSKKYINKCVHHVMTGNSYGEKKILKQSAIFARRRLVWHTRQ